jgi:hypothetical protein
MVLWLLFGLAAGSPLAAWSRALTGSSWPSPNCLTLAVAASKAAGQDTPGRRRRRHDEIVEIVDRDAA